MKRKPGHTIKESAKGGLDMGTVTHITVGHDKDCPALRTNQMLDCTCQPEIKSCESVGGNTTMTEKDIEREKAGEFLAENAESLEDLVNRAWQYVENGEIDKIQLMMTSPHTVMKGISEHISEKISGCKIDRGKAH